MTEKMANNQQVATIEVTADKTKNELYWTRWSWDEKKSKFMVICNYPPSLDPMQIDTTKLLIFNHMKELDAGSITVANLFYTPLSRVDDNVLRSLDRLQDLKHLVNAGKDANTIILATGSFTSASKIAGERLN